MKQHRQNIEYHRQQRNAFTRRALQAYDRAHNCRDSRGLVALYISYAKAHHRKLQALMENEPEFARNEQEHCPHCGQYWELHREWRIPASATEPGEYVIRCEFRNASDRMNFSDELYEERRLYDRGQTWLAYEDSIRF